MPEWSIKLLRRIVALAKEPGRYMIVLTIREGGNRDWTVTRLGKLEEA
jgi:hypothetical protein